MFISSVKSRFSAKSLFAVIPAALIFLAACNSEQDGVTSLSNGTAKSNDNSKGNKIALGYLDLTVDPVIPGGVTPSHHLALISQGYVLDTLDYDLYVEGMQSKNSTGQIYYRTGTLEAGTPYYWNGNTDTTQCCDAMAAACANVYDNWRWQVRAGH